MADSATLKQIAPSTKIIGQQVTMTLEEFSRLIRPLAEKVQVDERWYLAQYHDVADAVTKGIFPSATQHYVQNGFIEGRLPRPLMVDEGWYLRQYPDVAAAIAAGRFKSAAEHFLFFGCSEGRYAKQP